MECVICKTEITAAEVSQFAAYGGLPSPCCNICFQVNDYSIKSQEELKIKSLLRRFQTEDALADARKKTLELASKKPKWKIETHSHQIADTGDYDGCYEITNGKISFFTKDDNDNETLELVVKALNESDCEFYIDDSDKFEAHSLREENKRLHFMIENGLTWKDMENDMENDITYPIT